MLRFLIYHLVVITQEIWKILNLLEEIIAYN